MQRAVLRWQKLLVRLGPALRRVFGGVVAIAFHGDTTLIDLPVLAITKAAPVYHAQPATFFNLKLPIFNFQSLTRCGHPIHTSLAPREKFAPTNRAPRKNPQFLSKRLWSSIST